MATSVSYSEPAIHNQTTKIESKLREPTYLCDLLTRLWQEYYYLEEQISISYLPGRVVDIGFESVDFSMVRLGCILWETKKFLERIQNHVVFVHVELHNPILVWILIFSKIH